MNKYRVTCLNCKNSDSVGIDADDRLFWSGNTSIISGRKRFDNQWGWQCICSNSSIVSDQEEVIITNKQNPAPEEVSQIVRNPKKDKKIKFEMERV